MSEIRFAQFTKEERRAVEAIVARVMPLFARVMARNGAEIMMDLSVVHAHTPLRLAELAEANDFDFAHDLFGIYHHLNRKTGKLEDFFTPRFASGERGAPGSAQATQEEA